MFKVFYEIKGDFRLSCRNIYYIILLVSLRLSPKEKAIYLCLRFMDRLLTIILVFFLICYLSYTIKISKFTWMLAYKQK